MMATLGESAAVSRASEQDAHDCTTESGLEDLCALLDELLTRAVSDHQCQPGATPQWPDRIGNLARAWASLAAGDWLSAQYALSPLDEAVLAVLLVLQFDPVYRSTLAYLQDDVSAQRPSLAFTLRLLGLSRGRMLEALPTLLKGPLFTHRLVEMDETECVPSFPASRGLTIDRQVLALFLPGSALDESLIPFCRLIRPLRVPEADSPGHSALLALHELREASARRRAPLRIHLRGPAGSGRHRIAALLAAEQRMSLISADLCALPAGGRPARLAFRLCREAWWRGAVLYCHGAERLDPHERDAVCAALADALDAFPVHCVTGSSLPWPAGLRMRGGLVRLDLSLPEPDERARLWRRAAAARGRDIGTDTAHILSGRFRLGASQIEQAVDDMLARDPDSGQTPLGLADCSAAARALCGHALEQLARRVCPRADWTNLILPPDTEEQLREISRRAAQRAQLAQAWGTSSRLVSERGVTVLFAGPSGTGKTLAAEVIAADLGLDLFCVDLAQVVSKYIGETEKNLDRVFEAAESANAVLFFDEADALFGKRSEVKDAHDRYANLEIAYLLQKMEQFEGLAILATNLRQNIDDAFTRRVSFAVTFPLPQETERRRLWQAHWPEQLARDASVDLDELARSLPLAGGNIRNLVLAAAHFAATDACAVERSHLLRATQREYQKMGKTLAEADWRRLGLAGSQPAEERAR